MKELLYVIVIAALTFVLFSSAGFAFGEVAGPVTIYVPVGGTNVGQWGIFNGDPIDAALSAQGDAAQYLSFPTSVSLPGNNQVYSVPITANIPSNANLPEGTNITGTLYALAQGQPGQVQINLQVKKNIFIIVGNPPQGLNQVSSSSQTSAVQQTNSLSTGFASLPTFDFNLAGAFVAGIVIFLAFVFISRRFGFRQEEKIKPQRKRR